MPRRIKQIAFQGMRIWVSCKDLKARNQKGVCDLKATQKVRGTPCCVFVGGEKGDLSPNTIGTHEVRPSWLCCTSVENGLPHDDLVRMGSSLPLCLQPRLLDMKVQLGCRLGQWGNPLGRCSFPFTAPKKRTKQDMDTPSPLLCFQLPGSVSGSIRPIQSAGRNLAPWNPSGQLWEARRSRGPRLACMHFPGMGKGWDDLRLSMFDCPHSGPMCARIGWGVPTWLCFAELQTSNSPSYKGTKS